MKRREFLELSASAGIISLINAHTAFAAAGCSSNKADKNPGARITALRLLTIAPLAQMKKFYGEIIGLPVTEKDGELMIHAGESIITFVTGKEKDKRPFYHVAFNIPENKIQPAIAWQRKKTPVIHPNPSGTKDEVVHFAHWNAHSLFFLDPAGNLLEYIARHDLSNAATGDFTVNDILYASEIGLIVDDVIASGTELQKRMKLAQYKDPAPGFWPIGDESGLLLMIRKNHIWAGHPGLENKTDIFKTAITIRTTRKINWQLPGYPYVISSVP
jgi:hypothetical protein